MNTNNAATSSGDQESYTSIPGYPGTCDEIITSECRVASTNQPYTFSGQDVICDKRGLYCEDSPMQTCLDYKIRFYCSCKCILEYCKFRNFSREFYFHK